MKRVPSWYTMFLLLVSILVASLSAAAETITLVDETEIKYAATLNEAIDRLSEKVMSCVENNSGKTEECICVDECSCKFKDEYISAKDAYDRAIRAYPQWDGKVVFYRIATDPTGYNINFEGLRRQFSAKCGK
jgi:hypothetical protein